MNQRRDDTRSSAPTIALVVAFALIVAAAVYWVFIRDDGDDKNSGSKKPTTVAAKTFTAPGNSFSFKFPGNFVETAGPQGYVWIAGIGPYDIMSVKRIENQPTSPGRLLATIPKTLMLVPGTTINSRTTEQHGGLKMVAFGINLTLDGQAVNAKLYYFSANGVTWQLACESQNQVNAINNACSAALESFQSS